MSSSILKLSSGTRAKFACCILIAVWAYAFWPTVLSMITSYWKSSFDLQGFIIVPIVLGLVLRSSSALNRTALTYSPYGLLLLLFSSTVWLLAAITKLPLLEQLALISMLPAIVLTTCGQKITSILAIPLLCLFLLIPFGQDLYLNLQQIFSVILVKILAISKQAVYWEGNTIFVDEHEYIIPNLLSGLQYMSLYLTIGITYACTCAKNFAKIILVASSFIVFPVLLLIIAIYSLILVQSWFNLNMITIKYFQEISWTIVSIALLNALLFGFALRDKQKFKALADNIDWRSDAYNRKPRWLIPTLIASTVILFMPTFAHQLQSQAHYANNAALLQMPTELNTWSGPIDGKYRNGQQEVVLNLSQRAILTTNNILSPNSGQHLKTNTFSIQINNRSIPIIEMISKYKTQNKIVWSVHYTNGHLTINHILTKVLENLYTVSKHGAEVSTITIETETNTDLANARYRLSSFLEEVAQNSQVVWLQ
jgi:hypothetical protein